MSKEKKLKEKNLELGYTIEALQDEVEYLKQDNADRRAKLWEVICENDRLTLTYEPYRPPGDEDENIGYYDLIEEVKTLNKRIILQGKNYSSLSMINDQLRNDNQILSQRATTVTKTKKFRFKNDRWWNFSFELWPGAWGLNYYRYDWQRSNATAREGQMQVGPFGFSWNREPKR